MLKNMTSAEITEWMAFYRLRQSPETKGEKGKSVKMLKAMFAHKVVKGTK